MKKGHILSIFFAVSVSAAAMFGAACSEDAAVITEFDVPSFIEVNVNSENVLPTVTAVSDDGKKYPAAVEITDEGERLSNPKAPSISLVSSSVRLSPS